VQQKNPKGLATAALVVGIVSIIAGALVPIAGIVLGLAAVVLGAVPLVRAQRGTEPAPRSATAGLMCGGAGIVVALVAFTFYLNT